MEVVITMGEKVVATPAVLMGVAIGILTVALGLGLVGSPWEFHFAAHYIAAIAMVFTGSTVVTLGVIMLVDLLDGRLRHRHQH